MPLPVISSCLISLRSTRWRANEDGNRRSTMTMICRDWVRSMCLALGHARGIHTSKVTSQMGKICMRNEVLYCTSYDCGSTLRS